VILEIDSEGNGSKRKGEGIAPKKGLDNCFQRRGLAPEFRL